MFGRKRCLSHVTLLVLLILSSLRIRTEAGNTLDRMNRIDGMFGCNRCLCSHAILFVLFNPVLLLYPEQKAGKTLDGMNRVDWMSGGWGLSAALTPSCPSPLETQRARLDTEFFFFDFGATRSRESKSFNMRARAKCR